MNETMDQMTAQTAPVEAIQANISGDVSGQVAVGSYILQIGSIHGGVVNINLPEQKPRLKARPGPVYVLPRRFSGLLDRVEEVGAASAALPASRPTEFYADGGMGKTSLLRVLARHPLTGAFPDGVIYLSARGQMPADLLQSIFDALFEFDAPYKPSEGEMRLALQTRRALILLDDVDQNRDDVEGLFDAAPECTFLLASPERKLWGDGLSLALPGLPVQEARQFLEQQLGRPLSEAEKGVADDLCKALGGRPLALMQAAALAREQGVSIENLAALARKEEPERKMCAFAFGLLSPAEARVSAAIGAMDGAPLNLKHLPAVTGVKEVQTVVGNLQKRGLVQQAGSGYTLAGSFSFVMGTKWDLGPWRESLLEYFSRWSRQELGDPNAILNEMEGLLRLVDAAVNTGSWHGALRLARLVEGALALTRRWGAWERVLQNALRAAEALGDLPGKAWALHQLGTRMLSLGENEAARQTLVRALRLRQMLGDQAGAAVTRHNLNLLIGPPPGGEDGSSPSSTPPSSSPPMYSLALNIFGAVLITGMMAASLIFGSRFIGSNSPLPTETRQPFSTVTPMPQAAVTENIPVTGPTETPVPSETPTPTETPTATFTLTPTSTLTPTPTDTPVPPVVCVPAVNWPVYIVRYGDTLSSIGRAASSNTLQLMQANCLPDTRIYAGQRLFVPRLPVFPTAVPTITFTPTDTPTTPPPPPPDLVITSFQAGPASPMPGTVLIYTYPVSVTVSNLGGQPAGSFQVGVFVNGKLHAPASLSVAMLAPGSSATVSDVLTTQADRLNTLVVRAAADICSAQVPCQVEESDESNNQSADQIVTLPRPNLPPDVYITNPDSDTTLYYEGSADGSGYIVVVLQGRAVDPEDGDLPGDTLTWAADQQVSLDPPVGNMIKAQLYSPDCSEETYTVSLTARDKDGAPSTVTRRITLLNKYGCEPAAR